MKAIFAEHAYAVILFNDIGLYAWEPGRIPEGQYEPLLRAHLANLRTFAPKAKLIFASTTPMTTKTKPIALDPEFNSLIVERHSRMLGRWPRLVARCSGCRGLDGNSTGVTVLYGHVETK